MAAAACFVTLAAGDPALAWRTLQGTLASHSLNPYVAAVQSGPWMAYLVDFLLLSPLMTVGYLAWLGYLLGGRVRDPQMQAWALVPLLFLIFTSPFAKNVRYALALEWPLRLGAVELIRRLAVDRVAGRWQGAALALAVLGLAWLDLRSFDHFFRTGGIYDPVSLELLARAGILPL
jgi:hypothetical protein